MHNIYKKIIKIIYFYNLGINKKVIIIIVIIFIKLKTYQIK